MENKSRNSKLPADAEDILDFDAETDSMTLEQLTDKIEKSVSIDKPDDVVSTAFDEEFEQVQRKRIKSAIHKLEDAKTTALPDLNDSANLNHIVLVELPATSDSPPKPHANPRLEFEKFTPPILSHFPELPWGSSAVASSRSKDKPYPNEYWSNVIKSIDNFISLDESKIKIGDIMEFIRKMLRNESDKRFYALEKFFGQTPEEEQAKIVRTIKGIAQLVKRGPELFPKGIPMLKQVPKCKVRQFYPEAQILDCNMTMSQEQCAVLLANAFFGTFSQSKRENNYNRLSFVGIFCGTHKQTISKLHFTFEYFSRVLESMPTGVVSFRRISYGRTITSERRKQLCTDKISDCTLSVSSTEKIEEFDSHRHMDFSNSYIGGGVLGPMGSAQEEIRFLTCPEMIVSCLICERMSEYEAIEIIGAQTFSSYTGYGHTLKFEPNPKYGSEDRDSNGRICSYMLAIDATSQGRTFYKQYLQNSIRRELRKCFVGYESGQPNLILRLPIATGNWGCGAFRGDPQLKFLIQLLVAAILKIPLSYSTFGDPKLAGQIQNVYRKLSDRNTTTQQLYDILMSYNRAVGSRINPFTHVLNQI